MRRLILITIITCFLFMTAQAQDGQGVIRQGVISNLDSDIRSFNPLLCSDSACNVTTELLFPTLLAVDRDTGWFTSGTQDNHAMATDWTWSDDNLMVTFQLRDDAFWSDGTPITAYDYFYSYWSLDNDPSTNSSLSREITLETIDAVIPLSESELAVVFAEVNCDALPYVDLPFVPSHVFDEHFAETTADFFANNGDNPREMWTAWDEANTYDMSLMRDNAFNDAPLISGTNFQFVDWDNRDHIRLQSGDVALELLPVANLNEMINRFFMGNLDIVPIPPERLADFTSNPDVQVLEMQSSTWDFIAFNLADSHEPRSAFDEDGNALEQGEHPILGNLDIRRAIQFGIDKQAVIDIALHGQATPLSSFAAPTSWFYDDSANTSTFNTDDAERLLEDAGWARVAGRNIRECVNCGTAEDGTSLRLSLAYGSRTHQAIAAIVIQQQLRRIGIDLSIYPSDFGVAFAQTFDLYFGSWFESYPSSPNFDLLFTPQADIVNNGGNFTSYNNPNVTALLQSLKDVPQCDLAERQSIYAEVQSILQAELPIMSLYSEIDLLAVRADIQNVTIYPDDIYWNLDDWVVFNAP